MIQKLHHLSTRKVSDEHVFDTIESYGQLTPLITAYGLAGGESESDEYNERVGEALEVYAEFFLTRYGTDANPRLNILEATHTSTNKYNAGFDLSYKDFSGNPGHLQVKFRSNPTHKFKASELSSFVQVADGEGIPADRRCLFTNLEHKVTDNSENGFYHWTYPYGMGQMRQIDSSYQEQHIDRDPSFWTDFVASIEESAKEPDEFLPIRTLRPHQKRMYKAIMKHITPSTTHEPTISARGRIICATGGGKTEVEFQTIRDIFLNGAQLCVMVGPTIDLIRQHHEYFQQFGLFHKDDIAVVHFRTGDESKTDTYMEYAQTTNAETYAQIMTNYSGKQVLIFVTYASEEHLFNIIRDRGETVDYCVWDEFQHLMKQQAAYKNHLLSLPVKANGFFSASQKRGRIICSLDEEIFGPLLEEVTFRELREVGILVPQLIIKPIRINPNGSRLARITRELSKVADSQNFCLGDAIVEAAASIVARQDLLDTYGRSNIITFSKAVPICKAVVKSNTITEMIPECLIQTVHAGVPARNRMDAYEKIKTSDDSILHQHSVVKEGIDVTAFNASIVSRVMDMMGTQQGAIGRIARADPLDTEALKAGKISLDSPDGWHKYSATIYVTMHDDDMDNFRETMRELISKLQFAGLEESDYQFGEINEAYTGTANPQDGDVPIIDTTELFEGLTLQDYVRNLQLGIDIPTEDERVAAAFDGGFELPMEAS